MSDPDDVGLVIASKPGGFLEVAPRKWVRWDRIDGVEADDSDLRVCAHHTWSSMGCGTREMALAWADALFAAIARERALELGTPLQVQIPQASAAKLFRDWQEATQTAVRHEVHLESGRPWPGERFDTTSMKVPPDALR